MSAEVKDLQIIPFQENALQYIDELVRLDFLCFSSYGTTWVEDNFRLDLPQKSKLSKLAVAERELVGYLICSIYDQKAHIHRLAVNPEFGKMGIGKGLLKEVLKECLALKIRQVTVETLLSNRAANSFYMEMGFQRLGNSELKGYLINKGKENCIIEYISPSDTRAVYSASVEHLHGLKEFNMQQDSNLKLD